MKKVLLFASILSFAGANAQTLTEPKVVWDNFLTGITGQDQATDIVTVGTDQVYWMLTDGSKSEDRNVTYAGEDLYNGADYDGTSSNKNLTLLKTDAKGKKQWCVYSAWGDFSPNEGGLAVKSNGDVVFVCGVRHTEGHLDQPITIVDANGTETKIDWNLAADDRRWDRLIVGCVSAQGEMQWVKTYDVDNSPVPAASGTRVDFTADAINVCGTAIDNEDNIYVCGNFRTDMTFPKADGTNVVLHPKNVTGWDGDSQGTVGSFYLVKLDGNGYYLNNLDEEGAEISASYLQSLEWVDGKLYAYGYMKGNGTDSAEISGFSLTPSNYVSPIVGCLDADLKADWFKCYPGDAVGGKNAVQSVGMTVSEGFIWLAGMYNGKISDAQDATKFVESTQGNMREGFIIKLDQNDGAWIEAVDSRAAFNQNMLTGYLKVIVPASDTQNIYVYGYAMNATVGVFLRCYDRETLMGYPDNSWSLLTKGGVPTANNVAYCAESGSIYVTARGNNAFLPIGGEETQNPGGYTNILARFDLPKSFTTDVSEISEVLSNDLTVELIGGGLKVINNSDHDANLSIYDISGRRVKEVRINAVASEFIDLAPGLYIANGVKIIVK